MARRQVFLVAHAVALIAALMLLVPELTGRDPRGGYLAILALHWLGFCVPVILIHVWQRHDGHLFSERLAWRDWWVPIVLLAQVGLVAVVAFGPSTRMLTTQGAMLAAAVALLNGPLEETAWRGGFLTAFRNRPALGFWLGWVLFTCWHVPLALSQGIIFDGGALALVGGAALLGLLWSAIAWRTGSVFYTAIAHALTNALTFWVLFNRNGFVPPHP